MKQDLVISLDGMGGDHAPLIVVEGAWLAHRKNPNLRYLIYGNEAELKPLVERYPGLSAVSDIRHTPDRVKGDDKPALALRQGRNSSMRLAIDAVASGEADCVVSAGNTGALMAMAKFALKVLPGIDRPAIAAYLPTRVAGHGVVMLDLGANTDCDKNNLLEFSILGAIFSKIAFKIDRPRIGILNIGSEAMKGSDLVKETAEILSSTHLPGDYIGFAEGDDFQSGAFDVVVTDGFTGNVTLKTVEGTAKLLKNMMKEAVKSSWLVALSVILCIPFLLIGIKGWKKFYKRIDPRYYNGASFLGLKGLCIKSHGGTDGIGFANAIGAAAELAVHNFIGKVEAELSKLPPREHHHPADATGDAA